jgi:hypothetical protein
MRLGTPRLDFLVIGAQKAGTTALWRLLEDNPRLRMPAAKEAPFFLEPAYPDQLRPYLRALFKDAPRRARLGTVTPGYMHGVPGVAVPEVARRIHAVFPDVRLVALLREPAARARSAHRMMMHRGEEPRSFADAVAEQLEPAALERARATPNPCDTYVTAGEYGRLLGHYLEEFPREQLHVELTADLERDPRGVVARVCEFVGVAPHVPRHAGTRFHQSGPPRVSPAAEAELKDYLARHVWARMRHPEQERDQFDRWFELWNVEGGPPEPAGDDEPAAARLREHYAEDARRLEALLGLRVPWAPA